MDGNGRHETVLRGSDVDRHIVRRRLLDRVAEVGQPGPALTTVIAPPGSGKSIFLRSLLPNGNGSGNRPGFYLSLAECEHHPALFLDLLLSGASRALPEANLSPLLNLKRSAQLHEYGERIPYLLDQLLTSLGMGPVRIILDDFDQISPSEPLGSLVKDVVLSDLPSLQMVLGSHRQIPLDLDVYRRRGKLLELNGDDLAFTPDEVAELLQHWAGRELPAGFVRCIWERTRGWAGVLGLIGKWVRGRNNAELKDVLGELSGHREVLVDFVVNRLLAGYTSPARYVLKVVSILDRIDRDTLHGLFADKVEVTAGHATSGRMFIVMPETQLEQCLEELLEGQALYPCRENKAAWELNPLVRDTLRSVLAAEEPQLFREAHHRAAAWYLNAGLSLEVSSIDHLIEAGDFDRAMSVLQLEAEHIFLVGYYRRLSHWLEKLEAHYEQLPFWGAYYMGRVCSAKGEWSKARDYLDHCKSVLQQTCPSEELWRWQPRLFLGYARMYWRRGIRTEASTYCKRGLGFIEQFERRNGMTPEQTNDIVGLKLELLNLLVLLKMDAALFEKAEAVCDQALEVAATWDLRRQECVFSNNLGLIAFRRGDLTKADDYFVTAQSKSEFVNDPELLATILYHRGLIRERTGDVEGCKELVGEALDLVVDSGHPAIIAKTFATLGRVCGQLGQMEEGQQAFLRAEEISDRVGNMRTCYEIAAEHARFLAVTGQRADAGRLLATMTSASGSVLREDASLTAIRLEAQAECHAGEGNFIDALEQGTRALGLFKEIDSNYEMAHISWRLACWQIQNFREGGCSTPEQGMTWLDEVCEATHSNGYAFAANAQWLPLLHAGVAYGPETTRAVCQATLESMGVDARIWGLGGFDKRTCDRFNSYRRSANLADDYLVTTRTGRERASSREITALLERVKDNALTVLAHEKQLFNHGKYVSLAEKRVLLPLLLHFLKHPQDTFPMQDLTEVIWGEEARKTMQTKVKVAISRLRGLLGKGKTYVETSRVPVPDGGTVVAYGLAEGFDYYLIEEIPVDID